MERLTVRHGGKDNVISTNKGIAKVLEKLADYEDAEELCIKECGCSLRMVIEKYKEFLEDMVELAEYRQAEEQGLLLRLPCKVGSTVYRINKDARNPIIPLVVTEVRFKALKSGQVVIKIMCSDDVMTRTDGCSVYYEEEIGNKIFLTREEAEQALAEMQKG